MASLAAVFTEKERTNWLKAWLAVDLAKSGLEQFVENEAKLVHACMYNTISSGGQAPAACNGCQTANLLKCPTPGLCNKQGPRGVCSKMHDAIAKQFRPCPLRICDKVLIEIVKAHRYTKPSWRNTSADQWASNYWQIAKAYLPPDGYAEKSSVKETDFNGMISFMMNCKHFDSKFSFPIAPGKPNNPCLLTKARDIGRTVRHSSQCKVTDTAIQDIFTTLNDLLTDPTCLANDGNSQDAVRKLRELANDVLNITSAEMIQLLKAAQDTLKKVENISQKTLDEMRVYLELCRKDLKEYMDTCKQELNEHAHHWKRVLDGHYRASAELNYEQFREDFRRQLMEHYNNSSSSISICTLYQSFDKRLIDIYSTPYIYRIKIENDGSRRKEKEEVLNYKNLLYTYNNRNRCIYVQGEPGRGKSTFAAKLVHDWSQQNQSSSSAPSENIPFDDVSIIREFKLIFFISLRDSRGQTAVTKMIRKQVIDHLYDGEKGDIAYKHFLRIIETELCLVVRDGLDEWLAPDGINLVEPSMVGFSKDKCTVLTTSRPWKLADERIKDSQLHSLFEIEGICDPDQFIQRVLRCIIDEKKDLKKTVEEFKSFTGKQNLKSLSSSPMLYALVICTWVDTLQVEENLQGSSSCALYTKLLECLCKKANSTIGYFNELNPPPIQCFSETSYVQPNIEHLDKLSEALVNCCFPIIGKHPSFSVT